MSSSMKRLLAGLAQLREWVLPSAREGGGLSVADLDPAAGRALARALGEELAAHSADLLAVDVALREAREALVAVEARERRLGDRIYRYREELRERRAALDEAVPPLRACDDEEYDGLLDEENPDVNDAQELRDAEDYARLVQEWERDKENLERAMQNQKILLMHCETMRRQLRALEANRQKFETIQCKYKDFMSLNGVEEPIGRDERTEQGLAQDAIH